MNNQQQCDAKYMALAEYVSAWSTDRSRKTACVIVDDDQVIRAIGVNEFPRGIADIDERHERPAKYLWTEHAERNAVYNAARVGISLQGCTAYNPWFPCMDCARSLLQSGVKTLVAYKPDFDDPRWGNDFKNVVILFKEAGVTVRFLNKQ